jgi:two-component system, chemotaxis family, chemotaxis protein CheY
MVTAENDMARMARAFTTGVDEYALQPLTRDMIVAKLEMLGLVTV